MGLRYYHAQQTRHSLGRQRALAQQRTAGAIPGLVVHHQPSGHVLSADQTKLTGWVNEATGRVVSAVGSPGVLANDADFNGQRTAVLSIGNQLNGQQVSATNGLTIFSVDRFLSPLPDGNGTMPWYMEAGGAPLDVWTFNSNDHPRRGLNTFGSQNVGFDLPPARRSQPEFTTTVLPNDIGQVAMYFNGVSQPVAAFGNNPNSGRTLNGNIFPGNVSSYSEYSMRGKKAEFIVYNRLLGDTELAQVHEYLRLKYNIQP